MKMVHMCNDLIDEDEDEEYTSIKFADKREKKFRHRVDYLTEYDEVEFIKRFRLSKQSFSFILNRIKSEIKTNTERFVYIFKR